MYDDRKLFCSPGFLHQSRKGTAGCPGLLRACRFRGSAPASCAVFHQPKVRFSVRDLGAKGDGSVNDTAAIQQAVDRCAVFGGGEVLPPAGNYLTGAIALRSDTLLCLDEGATPLGTPDFADYTGPLIHIRNVTGERSEGLRGNRAGAK